MKKLKLALFMRAYRNMRRYIRWSEDKYRSESDKLTAKAEYDAIFEFIVDQGLEDEYLVWRAELEESAS